MSLTSAVVKKEKRRDILHCKQQHVATSKNLNISISDIKFYICIFIQCSKDDAF